MLRLTAVHATRVDELLRARGAQFDDQPRTGSGAPESPSISAVGRAARCAQTLPSIFVVGAARSSAARASAGLTAGKHVTSVSLARSSARSRLHEPHLAGFP